MSTVINAYAHTLGGGQGAPIAGPDGTQNYVPVTIQSSEVPSALSDYPVYVRLSDLPAAFWSGVQSDGGDIRVTEDDGSTRAPVDLESIDTGSDEGELHFLASSVSASSNTTYRIYYNGSTTLSQPAVGDTYGRNAVWSSDHGAVWHLSEDPTGGADAIVDSTGNGRDGTANGSMASGDQVTGKIGGALDFDGSDDYIDFPQHIWRNQFAVEFWVNAPAQDDNYIFGEGNDSDSNPVWGVGTGRAGGGQDTSHPKVFIRDDNGNNGFPNGVEGTATAFDGTWHHVVGVQDGDVTALYVDGSPAGSDTQTNTGTLTLNEGAIGVVKLGGSPIDAHFEGTLDEMRTRTSLPANYADHVAALHANQNAPTTFYSVGSEQSA